MEMMNENEAKDLQEAQANIWKYTFNYITSMSLKCALQLGIPDIIASHDKPLTLSELVMALSVPVTKSPRLYRLMRILAHSGFFAVQKNLEDQECYLLTSSSKLFLKNHTTNLSPLSLMMMDPLFVTSCSSLGVWFTSTSDSTPFESAHGTDLWSYFGQNSAASESFHDGMASSTKFESAMVVKELKPMLEGFKSLVDVGGGTGSMATAISKALPNLKCTVFDLTHVVSNLQGNHNMQFVGGDMFHSVPSGNVILLKSILHDWTDEECVKILKKCRDAILNKDKGGKAIIIDIVLDNERAFHFLESQLCMDMLMMVASSGKERTENEWAKIILDAGFASYKITNTLSFKSIIEVFP